MNNEPVAWMQEFECSKTGQKRRRLEFEQIGIDDIPLYTHPVKEFNDGGEPVKNATYWKRQYNLMATQNDNLKSGLYHANEQIKYLESQIEALKKDLAKYDELAIDDLNEKRTVWCACGDSIPPNSGALCGNCVSARPSQTLLKMTFEEMYPIAEKHLGHAIGLYNWKIFGDAILRKASEK